MDIKKQYFECIKKTVEETYNLQIDKIKEVAKLFVSCIEQGGVVQLFGVRHGEEFVNELNYRAGGIAQYHAYKIKDLILYGKVDQSDYDSGRVYDDLSLIDKFESLYELDDRDMYCLVSFYGNEPLIIEIAKRAKSKGQKVVALVNKKSYDVCGGTLLDYCDAYLDMNSNVVDTALDIDGIKVGQISSTVANIIAQMLTAEVYDCFIEKGEQAPVLLSANINGADVHNNSLTDPYGRRIR